MVCETHLTTYINLLLEAIISVSRGLFCREPYGYQIHSQMSRVQQRDREDKGQEADGKKSSPTKQKPILGTKKRPT